MNFEKLAKTNPKQALALLDKRAAEQSLAEFIKQYWHIVEPATALVWGWVMDAICEHLEAVTDGRIKRLIINVPPGFCKSLICNVFWPAWEWARGMTGERYLCVSYSRDLTIRDNRRFLRLVTSEEFQRNWQIRLDQESVINVLNEDTGWKLASSIGGSITGQRGTKIIIDDGNNVAESESQAVTESTNLWVREVMPDRLSDMRTNAIVSIQQRTGETDVTATLLDMWGEECVWLMIPMEFDPMRRCGTAIGWDDPRTEDGELAWDERFPPDVIRRLKREKGPYAWAGQYQQTPEPRGGGIIKRDWWQVWDMETAELCGLKMDDGKLKYPPMEYIIQFCDTAYTEKEENDQSAGIVFGVFRMNGKSRIMMMEAWNEWLEFNALLNKIVVVAKKRSIDAQIIEAKASGKSIAQEIKRMGLEEEFSVIEVSPDKDKVARMHAVVPLFAAGCVYAPDKEWAERVIGQCAMFPKGKLKDLADCVSGGIGYLRKCNLAMLPAEDERIDVESRTFYGQPESLYDV